MICTTEALENKRDRACAPIITDMDLHLGCLPSLSRLGGWALSRLAGWVGVGVHSSGIVAGDFNAHLGPMWGPRAHKSPNVQGVLLGEVLDRCKLHALLRPWVNTYLSGNSKTIVDYILADVEDSWILWSSREQWPEYIRSPTMHCQCLSLLRHTHPIRKRSIG